MVFLMVREVFIFGFQHAEISCIFFRDPTVFAEEYSILILSKEFFCPSWLTTKFCNYSSELNHNIRHLIKQHTKMIKIIRVPSKMCSNEGCFGMFLKHTMLFFYQIFPGFRISSTSFTSRMCGQLQPA